MTWKWDYQLQFLSTLHNNDTNDQTMTNALQTIKVQSLNTRIDGIASVGAQRDRLKGEISLGHMNAMVPVLTPPIPMRFQHKGYQ
jgi:hypothetical protein